VTIQVELLGTVTAQGQDRIFAVFFPHEPVDEFLVSPCRRAASAVNCWQGKS